MTQLLIDYLKEQFEKYSSKDCDRYLKENYKWSVGESFIKKSEESSLPMANGGKEFLDRIKKIMSEKGVGSAKSVSLDLEMTFILRKIFSDYFTEFETINENHIPFIVNSWGGIDVKDAKLFVDKYLSEFKEGDPRVQYERISSSTKVLSFYRPTEYVIYDSRVIFSLNWLIFRFNLINPKDGGAKFKFFPQPSSENGVVKRLNYSALLVASNTEAGEILRGDLKRVHSDGGKTRFNSLIAKAIEFDKDDAYKHYVSLLRCLSRKLLPDDDWALTKVEMMLFAVADKNIAADILNYSAFMYREMANNHG